MNKIPNICLFYIIKTRSNRWKTQQFNMFHTICSRWNNYSVPKYVHQWHKCSQWSQHGKQQFQFIFALLCLPIYLFKCMSQLLFITFIEGMFIINLYLDKNNCLVSIQYLYCYSTRLDCLNKTIINTHTMCKWSTH